MNFRKSSEIPKINIADFCHYRWYFGHEIRKNLQHDVPKMRDGVKGRLELFQKFIRCGGAGLPLVKRLMEGVQPKGWASCCWLLSQWTGGLVGHACRWKDFQANEDFLKKNTFSKAGNRRLWLVLVVAILTLSIQQVATAIRMKIIETHRQHNHSFKSDTPSMDCKQNMQWTYDCIRWWSCQVVGHKVTILALLFRLGRSLFEFVSHFFLPSSGTPGHKETIFVFVVLKIIFDNLTKTWGSSLRLERLSSLIARTATQPATETGE